MQRLNDKIESLRPNRKKPTAYPFLLFHGIRTGQLLAAMVTGAVMYFFLWHLRHGHWSIPWTFIFLSAAASGTIIALIATIVLHCLSGLNPGLNVSLNGTLFVIWTLGFSFLSWFSARTLGHGCGGLDWQRDAGIMVCRMYKALYAFTVLGFVSTAAAFILDVVVLRKAISRGRYNQMEDLDDKNGTYPLRDNDAWRMSTEHFAPSAAHVADGQPSRQQQRPYGEERKGPATQPLNDGYAVPEEQFGGYDTEYHGGSGAGRGNPAY